MKKKTKKLISALRALNANNPLTAGMKRGSHNRKRRAHNIKMARSGVGAVRGRSLAQSIIKHSGKNQAKYYP